MGPHTAGARRASSSATLGFISEPSGLGQRLKKLSFALLPGKWSFCPNNMVGVHFFFTRISE